MKRAVFAGFFDPITTGHIDVLQRASEIFDEIIIAVAEISSKRATVSLEVRQNLVEKAVSHIKNVKVYTFSQSLVDFCQRIDCKLVLRGMRNIDDFEYERQLNGIYKSQDSEMETIYLVTKQSLSHISSSAVREIAEAGGRLEEFVPKSIINEVIRLYTKE